MDIKIQENFVLMNYNAKNKEEVIGKLAGLLEYAGYVKKSFLNAVIEREKQFPTGLPTLPISVAIPHTDPEHCVQPAVAVAVLQNTVKFGLMGSDVKTVDVKIIFLLALNKKESQAVFLSKFSDLIGNADDLERILNAKNPSEIINLLEQVLKD